MIQGLLGFPSSHKQFIQPILQVIIFSGGDFENFDGTGGKSIYGAKFDDGIIAT